MQDVKLSSRADNRIEAAVLLPEQSRQIATFDVFDTVLTRVVGLPESSFLLLGNKLKALSLLDCSAEEFARIRLKAEHQAFHNAGGLDSEVDLYQIYIEVGMAMRIPEERWRHFMEVEVALEHEITRAVPKAAELVQAARDRGEKIVFVSDMYLGENQVRDLLVQHGLYKPGDLCHVSSDHAKSKASGAMFQELLRIEGVAPQQVTHCGNNSWSDVRMAVAAGLKVNPFLEGNPNRYEEILESYTWSTGGLSSVMAGASRLARLTVPANSIREAILRDVAAGVASPTIVGLVLWVLQGAKQLGLKRIYFVARDGQVMLEVARRLIKKLDFDCELRYLYGSRKAWLLPSVTKIDEEHLAGIFVGKLKLDVEFVSARLALDRLDVEPKEIQDGLASIGLCSSQDWDRNLTVEEREALTHLVLNDSVVQQVVLQKAAEARQLMVKYLEQEGLLEPIPFGMVDVGTGASLHYALSSVLDTVGQKPPVSFYLGLRGSSIEIPFGKPEAYFFDKHSNSGFFDYDTPGMNVLVELSCTADHGTVLGYKQVGDQVEPILKQQDNQAVMQWGFPIVRETMLRFSEYIYLNQELVNTRADVREACIAVENAFWSTPSSDEAQAWGSFPMEDGWGNHSHYHPLAEPYSWKDLKLPLLEGIPHGRRHWWHPGAFAMTPPLIKSTYNLCLRVGRKQKDIRIRLQLGQKLKALLRRKGR